MGCFLFLLGVEQVLYQIKQKIPRCCNRNSDNLMTTKTSTVRYSTTELSEDQGIFGFQSESSGSSRNLRVPVGIFGFQSESSIPVGIFDSSRNLRVPVGIFDSFTQVGN
jgi:hypothetical protein